MPLSKILELKTQIFVDRLRKLQVLIPYRSAWKNWQLCKSFTYNFFHILHKEKIFYLFGGFFTLVFLGGLGFALNEPGNGTSFWHRLGIGLWWAIVTITTVGYGDVVPQTVPGRLVGVALMISGLIAITLVTATVASIFVQRKIRREKGLEAITDRDQVIILGWNKGGEQVLRNLIFRTERRIPVVLVNNLPQENIESLLATFHDVNLLFVRGDYSREEILAKTNLAQARRIIILADRSDETPREQVDQRTLLAALAVKSINPKIRITAEIILPENRTHLERAHVDDIIIRGEYDSSLIASSTESEGLFKIMQTLLSPDGPNFWAVKIPVRFQGVKIKQFAAYLQEEYQALLIGLFTEGYKIRLEELLSPEPSAIDEFIYRKFTEAGKTYLFGRQKIEILINPPDDHIIGPQEVAVVISTKAPYLLPR